MAKTKTADKKKKVKYKNIFNVKLKYLKIYEVVDFDGEPQGLIATLATPEDMEKIIVAYKKDKKAVDQHVNSVDSFVEFMTESGYMAERIFLEDKFIFLPN